jgi:hypothetical protein
VKPYSCLSWQSFTCEYRKNKATFHARPPASAPQHKMPGSSSIGIVAFRWSLWEGLLRDKFQFAPLLKHPWYRVWERIAFGQNMNHLQSGWVIPLSFWYDAPLTSQDVTGGTTMAGLRFTELQSRPMIPGFHQRDPRRVSAAGALRAVQSRMAAWGMDGKCRIARRFTVYRTAPTDARRWLLFILTPRRLLRLQVVHGRLFGMVQGKTNQWIHVLLPALLAALRTSADAWLAPSRPWRSSSASQRPPQPPWSRRWRGRRPWPQCQPSYRTPPSAHDGTERRIVAPEPCCTDGLL